MRALVVSLFLIVPSLQAATLSFTGDLRSATFLSCGTGCTLDSGNTDADFAQFAAVQLDVNVPALTTLSAVTFSYGGGVNGNGAVIAQGGFQPYLSLFDSSGNFLASTYFGVTCPTGANANTDSGQCYDVLLDGGVLAPGTYSLVISAYANMSFAENLGSGTLSDGFTGLGGLAFGEDLHYAVDVILGDAAATSDAPEPTSFGLAAVGWLLCLEIRRRQK